MIRQERFLALDGWRGIAALAVAFYHVPVAHPFRDLGGWKNMEFFVDFFFVLSGFVIMHAWGSRLTQVSDARSFIIRRFWRVWPLHFVILAIFVGLELAKWIAGFVVMLPIQDQPFTASQSVGSMLTNLLMLQSLNLHGTTTWNGPAWSISVEFWTYAVFALAMLATQRRILALSILAIAGCAGVALLSPIYLFATHDFGFFRAIYGFSVGALAYEWVSRAQDHERSTTMLELVVVGAMALWIAKTGANLTSLFAPLVFAAVVVTFSRGGGLLTRFVESRPVQALGVWSYSIYLVHALIFYVLRMALVFVEKGLNLSLTASGSGSDRIFTFGSVAIDGIVIVTLLAVSVVISRQTYRWIEKPFMVPAVPTRQRVGIPHLPGLVA